MNFKSTFFRGTLLLTAAGLISRILGFFYRIFLANVIGAEGLGIYQMIFPIYSVCFSLCASGIETAISKLTAEKYALGKPAEAYSILKTGLFLTLTLSLGCSLLIHQYAQVLAHVFLKESRCASLLRILALTIPFGTTQSCICGYYLGIHQAKVPSAAQLIEQVLRIGCVFFLYHLYLTNHLEITPALAVIGLVFGELCSLLFTITCLSFRPKPQMSLRISGAYHNLKEILSLSAPLTISRICVNLLASLEATLIPNALRTYGMSTSDAFQVYGVFSGMALPFILFPNAFTGSIAMMLLPTVSEGMAEGNLTNLKTTLRRTFSFCLCLGFGALVFFLLFGNFLGNLFFSSPLAGTFLRILSWICPFLYLNTTLTSVLNGLGKTSVTFSNGILGLFLRIGFLFTLVPRIGIYGHLLGLLVSQLFVTLSSVFFLNRFLKEKGLTLFH